ncbi:histidine kinase [Salinisphaera orenii MK-B5]|uniref:Histidine kinase n=1 Tax=Salinisphaera orenii MK-B5 TaxID=856730 RepID=A0A423PQY7_9GAMM|nr:histidine kinase [Salinisphaera orenii]ROO28003.1 histidine kinase [Salinisphaera orenii MK-B5]
MQAAREPVEFLPDFCTGSRVLHVLLVCEAVAVVLALGEADPAALPRRLLLLSVYLQWIGICSAAALCLVRRHAGHLDARGVVALAYLILLAVTFAITEITFVAGRYAGFSPLFGPAGHLAFVARSLGICAVVAALALRYFWLRSAWRQHARAEVQARLEALQARIEPHFLFNSLNSVAALIAARPAAAERALEDLAALLRARLADDAPDVVALADELVLVEAYVRIEQLRLGERLTLDFDIDPAARGCRLPALMVQPLVENAIAHGVARLPAGGTVGVAAGLRERMLVVRVTNPLAADAPAAPGNRQALVNIRRRLALRYGDTARIDIARDEQRFIVDMQLPQDRPDS